MHYQSEYHGVKWSIAFLVNFIFTFGLFFYIINQTAGLNATLKLFFTQSENISDIQEEYPEFNNEELYSTAIYAKRSIKLAVVATIIANIVHLFYALAFPRFYIQLHLFVSLILSLLPAVLLFVPQTNSLFNSGNSSWGIFITLLSACFGIYLYIYRKKFVDTSAILMKTSATLVNKHPSLLFIEIIQSFILLSINILYLIFITVVNSSSSEEHFSPLIYVYGVFTYYWIIMTIYYTCYMITAGVIGFEFYHSNSQEKPKNLVLFSFKKAVTQNFGAAAFAGFILALIQTLKFLVEYLNPDRRNKKKRERSDDSDDNRKKDNGAYRIILFVLYYILRGILSFIESYFSYISRQALIYCAVFGCSYEEGCQRYHQKSFFDKINNLQHESIVSGAVATHYLLFMVLSGLAVYYAQSSIYHDEPVLLYITVFLTEIMMLTFFTFFQSLITTSLDTIFLCHLENPKVMRDTNEELYYKLEKVKYE